MHKNEKIALALAIIALGNVAVWPYFFEGRSDGLTASIQGILFSLPALIVDAIPQMSGRWARLLRVTPFQRGDVTVARVAIWACAAYGVLSLVAGVAGVANVDDFAAAYENCMSHAGATCNWFSEHRTAIEDTEQQFDDRVMLATFPIAAVIIGCMLSYWIANRSARPLHHVVVGAGILAALRASDVTLVRAFEGADGSLLRFLVTWLLSFLVWVVLGIAIVQLGGRRRAELARELAGARLNPMPTLPQGIAAAIRAKAPGHEVRIREKHGSPRAQEQCESRAALKDWGLSTLSLAIAFSIAVGVTLAVYGTGKIEGLNFSYGLFFLGLCTCAPIFVGLRSVMESPQQRFAHTWLRSSSLPETLILLVLSICVVAGISASILPLLMEYNEQYIANCAVNPAVACYEFVSSSRLGVAGVFGDFEASAVRRLEGALMFVLMFAVGVHIGSHARWAMSAAILVVPLVLLSIVNVYDQPEPPESVLYVVGLALLFRAAPLLLGVLVSKVGRSLELSRDRVIARELLKDNLSNRKLCEAIVSALGLDISKYELVARLARQ